MICSHHLSAILPISPAISVASASEILKLLITTAKQAGLTPCASTSSTFDPQGASAVVILAESHVAIHIWPEERQASVDIHVCNYHQNNRKSAEYLAQLLTAKLTKDEAILNENLNLYPQWYSLTIDDHDPSSKRENKGEKL